MPTLAGYSRGVGYAAGFKFALFKAMPGANADLVQTIGLGDVVSGFSEVTFEAHDTFAPLPPLELSIGQTAIWVFERPDGSAIVGDAAQIEPQLEALISSGELDDFPFLMTELVEFLGQYDKLADRLRPAFDILSTISEHSAAVWRDEVILHPIARRELANQISDTKARIDAVQSLRLRTENHTLTIEARFSAMPNPSFPRTQRIGQLLDVKRLSIRTTTVERLVIPKYEQFDWELNTVGSVANFILTYSPFDRTRREILSTGARGIRSFGYWEEIGVGPRTPPPTSFVVFPSDADVIAEILRATNISLERHGFQRRVGLLVRPIGFGTPSPRKVAKDDVELLKLEFDALFFIGNHRSRRLQGVATNLAASRVAAAAVRSAIYGYSRAFSTTSRRRPFFRGPGICLASPGVRSQYEDLAASVRRTVLGLLCEEYAVAEADDVIVFCPTGSIGQAPPETVVTIGRRSFPVRLIESPRPGPEMVALAINAGQVWGDVSWYSDFVAGLLVEAGWRVLEIREGVITAELYHNVTIFHLANSSVHFKEVSASARLSLSNVVITNQTIPKHYSEESLLFIFHHSDIQLWKEILGRILGRSNEEEDWE
jgi:hypothetical protein